MVTERQALIALNMIQEVGAITAQKLFDAFCSYGAALQATADELIEAKITSMARANTLAKAFREVDPIEEEERAEKLHINILTKIDSKYPEILKKIHDAPIVLYYSGDTEAFTSPAVAMVGTRNPTIYGRETAEHFAYSIASAGYTIVSGMARGIDTAAHRGVLTAKGRTIGVLGGAIDCFYPNENRELARNVARGGGLIISEYPLGRQPDRQTFPMRNRIISGLSVGTLVVEAALKSGSLITATEATEQGRAVMAIPGRIDIPTSQGCNKLIQDGARLVLSPDDVIDEISQFRFSEVNVPQEKPKFGNTKKKSKAKEGAQQELPFVPLSEEEQKLLDALGSEEMLIDNLIAASGVEAGRTNAFLISLQLKRRVKILPGGWVKRT